eukprot:GILJ01002545.1.p1 GENE.GILJ01002545.1~~GILJ01002545.1.p1  ORF type:complete len:867 (-),score=105.63 GILJ01002545.1:201-2801(-)
MQARSRSLDKRRSNHFCCTQDPLQQEEDGERFERPFSILLSPLLIDSVFELLIAIDSSAMSSKRETKSNASAVSTAALPEANATELSSKAFNAFHEGHYDQALDALDRLRRMRDDSDSKVVANMALTHYYKDMCPHPSVLLQRLQGLYVQETEKRANALKDNLRDTRSEPEDEDEEVLLEEEDTSVNSYNRAVLHFQLRQYQSCAEILEELFAKIEPIEDFVAVKICFLLLEVYLLMREPYKASLILQFLDKPQTFQTILQHKSMLPNGDGRPVAMLSTESQRHDNGTANHESHVPERAALQVQQLNPEELRSFLSSRPLPSLVLGNLLTRHGKAPDMIHPLEFKFLMHIFRARLYVLTRSLKSCKKELKAALEILQRDLRTCQRISNGGGSAAAHNGLLEQLRTQQNAIIQFLKADLEYVRGNHRKAIKLLNSCQQTVSHERSDPNAEPSRELGLPLTSLSYPSFYFNNLGCIHACLGKPKLAAFYFSKAHESNRALQSCTRIASFPGAAVSRFGMDRRLEILYNWGVQLLHSGQPMLAVKALQEASVLFTDEPKVWLRLAECIIALHANRVQQSRSNPISSHLVDSAVPQSRTVEQSRHLLDFRASQPDANTDTTAGVDLEYGLKCCRNAVVLIDSSLSRSRNAHASSSSGPAPAPDQTPFDHVSTATSNNLLGSTATPPLIQGEGEEERQKHWIAVRTSALLNMAYLHLCVGDCVSALLCCENIINTNFSDSSSYLAHTYAAEALCSLGRLKEAAEHLRPLIQKSLSTSSSNNTFVPSAVVSASGSQSLMGRMCLYVNMAAVHCLTDDVTAAKQFATQALSFQPDFAPALAILSYCHLRTGNQAAALQLISQRRLQSEAVVSS